MSPIAGWRPALRLAWRDVLRSRGRAILVLVMIALPVLAVTAADVVYATSRVNSVEGLNRKLGAADARLIAVNDVARVIQWIDPDSAGASIGSADARPATLPDAERTLGRHLPAVQVRTQDIRVKTERGAVGASATETDLADPLTAGLFRLTDGRWPATTGEVVVNRALADHGFDVGTTISLAAGTRRVVGVAESATLRSDPALAGLPGSIGLRASGEHTWLVGGGEVTWADVLALNRIGISVLSRQVVEHPPSESQLPPQLRDQLHSGRADSFTVLALIVSMALLEVVLLAGPAFAVGARRQARTLALMAASGGTPKQARRVILASGLVLGGLASLTGVLLGIGVARLAMPRVQTMSSTWFGPFDLNWTQLAAIAGFGLLSALLAAVVPAWIASRQNVVAVLAGRRGDRPPSLRSPALGVLLLAAGIVGSVAGARQSFGGEFLIAGSAIVSVIGVIFLVPLVVMGLSRVCGRLPLAGRYAVRDAARHRTRTVPAIAAVAATVAGVVALGIANTSDAAQGKATYVPTLPIGTGAVSVFGGARPDFPAYRAIVERSAPRARVVAVAGLPEFGQGVRRGEYRFTTGSGRVVLRGYSTMVSSSVLVSAHDIPVIATGIPSGQRAAAEAVLARGGAVVMTSQPTDADSVVLRGRQVLTGGRPAIKAHPARVPALFVVTGTTPPNLQAIVSPQVVRRSGLEARTVGLGVTGPVSSRQASDIREALAGLSGQVGFGVERGYSADQATRILLLILGVMGGALMLGGTLTATFLALSDAKPDLATLSAVGASPRMRRGVAAAYALVVGFVGALLGAAVGFIPGIAITYPLTSSTYSPYGGVPGPSHYLVVPWTLILTLVVALPLLTALIVGLAARSRLPLVARLD